MFVSKQFHDAMAVELCLGLDSQLRAIELTQNILSILNILSHLRKGRINTSNPKTRKQHVKMTWLLNSLWWTHFEYRNEGHKNFNFLMWGVPGNCWDAVFLREEMCHPREEGRPHLVQRPLLPVLLEIRNIGWSFHLAQAFVGTAPACGELLVLSRHFYTEQKC